MERRDFLITGLAATAVALSGFGVAEAAAATEPPRLVGLLPEHLDAVLAGKVSVAQVEALYISPDTKRVLIPHIAAWHMGESDTALERLERLRDYSGQVNAMLDSGLLRHEMPCLTVAEWDEHLRAWAVAMAAA